MAVALAPERIARLDRYVKRLSPSQHEMLRRFQQEQYTVRALSVTQPWAYLLACGEKAYETRSFALPYRGLLAIHATKEWTDTLKRTCVQSPFLEVLVKHGIKLDLSNMPTGAIIAVAVLYDCQPVEAVRAACSEQERAFGNFQNGRYAFRIANPTPLPFPVPMRGRLGLWQWKAAPGVQAIMEYVVARGHEFF